MPSFYQKAHRRGDFAPFEPQKLRKRNLSTRIEVVDGNHGRIHGDLTIRGVTCPATLDVEYSGISKSPWATTAAGFSASARLSCKEWGLTWNVALATGDWLIGDEIVINMELESVKQPEAVTEAA